MTMNAKDLAAVDVDREINKKFSRIVLILRNEGDEFAAEKPISFLAIVVCVSVMNVSSPNFLAI